MATNVILEFTEKLYEFVNFSTNISKTTMLKQIV